jgi:two-component system phosphate regulon response regulator OmpR
VSHAPTCLPDDAPHLMLVDDDRRIRDLLSRYLAQQGFRVTTAENGAQARAKLLSLSFDLLIVDVMMPGESGFDLVGFVRTHSNVPILMLTARAETEDRIQGLEIGADDYVTKPFEPRELALRITSILKRTQVRVERVSETVQFSDFVFHLAREELRRNDEVVHLTDREREMLRILAEQQGETVPRLALAGNGGAKANNDRTVDVQINRLRRKIERDPANPLIVQTVRGIGYRLMSGS